MSSSPPNDSPASRSAWTRDRKPKLQLALTALGMVAFCLFARSWRDVPHLLYDIPASLAVFGFVAQLLLERFKDGPRRYWLARLGMLVAMTIVTVGREFGHWNISGHLSCVLAVALVQSTDRRLSVAERFCYWIPLPIVLFIRWFLFDQGNHWQTYNAVIFALLAPLPAMLIALAWRGTTADR
jgi:hypothetical protein